MSAIPAMAPSPERDEDPTPKPASAVGPVERVIDRDARAAALLDYFASPPVEMIAVDAAWKEALALYGDEDSDAWVAALEDGTHPLCRVPLPSRAV